MWHTVAGSSATVQTHYVFDEAGHLIAEHDGATGAVLREYVWLDDMPLAMIDSTGSSPVTYYIHTGQIEEPLVMTDAAKAKVWDAYVEPFGTATVFGSPSAGLDLRLPGQFTQAETGALSQNWNRDYDTSLGRYIEADPIGLRGGQNVYGYGDGDPLGATDVGGLQLSQALAIPPPPTSGAGSAGSITVEDLMQALGIDRMMSRAKSDQDASRAAAKTVAQYCARCKTSLTRSQAREKAYEFADFLPGFGASTEGWNRFNPPWGDSFKAGPVWADFQRRHYSDPYAEFGDHRLQHVAEHPFGHPNLPGGLNHDCPHFEARNRFGLVMEFAYIPGSQ